MCVYKKIYLNIAKKLKIRFGGHNNKKIENHYAKLYYLQ